MVGQAGGDKAFRTGLERGRKDWTANTYAAMRPGKRHHRPRAGCSISKPNPTADKRSVDERKSDPSGTKDVQTVDRLDFGFFEEDVLSGSALRAVIVVAALAGRIEDN